MTLWVGLMFKRNMLFLNIFSIYKLKLERKKANSSWNEPKLKPVYDCWRLVSSADNLPILRVVIIFRLA